MTVFILWSMVESVYLSSNNKETKAGILLAFAAIVKMVPVVLLPYFLFRKKWKAAIVAMASGLFFFFLPMLVTGYHKFFEVIRYWIFTYAT